MMAPAMIPGFKHLTQAPLYYATHSLSVMVLRYRPVTNMHFATTTIIWSKSMVIDNMKSMILVLVERNDEWILQLVYQPQSHQSQSVVLYNNLPQ